jgi:hypothetical protein
LNIDEHSEFIENEIDLRIESLKIQLDELSNTYHDRLKFYKQIAKEYKNKFLISIVNELFSYFLLL